MKIGIPPEDVQSPKKNWQLIDVVDDGSKDNHGVGGCALALGKWDGKPVLAMRWNGDEENPIGNPQSRGIPTWFILPEKYTEAFLRNGGLSDEKVKLIRRFIPEAGPTFKEKLLNDVRYMQYFRWTDAHRDILKEIIDAGGQKHYDPNQDFILIRHLLESNQMQFIQEVTNAPEITYQITKLGRQVYAEAG